MLIESDITSLKAIILIINLSMESNKTLLKSQATEHGYFLPDNKLYEGWIKAVNHIGHAQCFF